MDLICYQFQVSCTWIRGSDHGPAIIEGSKLCWKNMHAGSWGETQKGREADCTTELARQVHARLLGIHPFTCAAFLAY